MSVFERDITLSMKLATAADGTGQEIQNRIATLIAAIKGVLTPGEQIREVRIGAIPWAPTAAPPRPDEQRGGDQEVFGA